MFKGGLPQLTCLMHSVLPNSMNSEYGANLLQLYNGFVLHELPSNVTLFNNFNKFSFKNSDSLGSLSLTLSMK